LPPRRWPFAQASDPAHGNAAKGAHAPTRTRSGSHLSMSTRDLAIAALTVLVIVVIIAFVL
jgi:hypothetical protein